jgi:tRNA(Ile2) C34 agmatinyltransferase TiaS
MDLHIKQGKDFIVLEKHQIYHFLNFNIPYKTREKSVMLCQVNINVVNHTFVSQVVKSKLSAKLKF